MSDEGAGAFLARLTAKLAAAGVPNMVVGSFASSFHGIPRSSQDLDLVIDPQPESLRRFLSDLPPEDYYADADTAFDALRRRAQFNVIDMATAWKADLIVRKARPFSVEEMRRRVEGDLLGAQRLRRFSRRHADLEAGMGDSRVAAASSSCETFRGSCSCTETTSTSRTSSDGSPTWAWASSGDLSVKSLGFVGGTGIEPATRAV